MRNGIWEGAAGLNAKISYVLTILQKFSVGSGLTDAQRRKPPKIGTVIVYRFQELTRDNVPRLVWPKFPEFHY
jgi:DNA ligase 1